jgi:hypothetical protein
MKPDQSSKGLEPEKIIQRVYEFYLIYKLNKKNYI